MSIVNIARMVLELGGVAPPEAKLRRMADNADPILLSDELLALMRTAAHLAGELHEPFITVRTLLLALLDEPAIGPQLADVLPRERLDAYVLPENAGMRLTASRIPEANMPSGERAALLRFNTLAFKVPDGSKSVWLSREAYAVWSEGARRVEEGRRFEPKHIAFGIAADAVRAPGVLADLHVAAGDVTDALLKL